MHMISKKDLNSAELETMTTSRSPTTVTTANGEVQTHEEATVHVKELDIFSTMKVLEDTPAVLSIRKLCDEHGYSCEWTNGQKPHLIKKGIRIQCNTENFVPIVVPVFFWNPRRAAVDQANPKSQNQKKTKTTIKNGETCVIPTYQNGCKSSEKILWMTEFLNTETHTPVLLMNNFWSPRLREVWIWVTQCSNSLP